MTITPHAEIEAWSIRCALGDDVQTVFASMMNGQTGHAPLPFSPHGYDCHLCAPIPHDPKRSKHRRFARRMDLFGIEVALEAAERANINADRGDGDRLGIFVGYGGLRAHWDEMMPSLMNQQPDRKHLWDNGLRAFHPFWMLRHLSNNAHALCANALDARGEGLTLAGTNAGAQAIESATRALHMDRIDTAIVFAYDSLIQPDVLVELASRHALSTATQRPHPAYDKLANGLIPGEAAAAIVLKRPGECATAKAKIWASAKADGARYEPAIETLHQTLSGFPLDDAMLIDGTSLARPELDSAEIQWLTNTFDDHTLLSSTASLGHTGAAQSLIQAITLTCALTTHQTPPIANLQQARHTQTSQPAQGEGQEIRSGLGLSRFAPGLTGAVLVRV